MALHGDIRVNGDLIAAWQARRVTELLDDGEHDYDVQVDWVAPRRRSTFVLRHAYRDGATALAAAVLARAAEDAPRPPDHAAPVPALLAWIEATEEAPR